MPARALDNPLVVPIMGLLLESPMHPYRIEHTLRARGQGDRWPLNRGALNSVVGALNGVGWICESERAQDGNRPVRTVYSLTEEGRVELEYRLDAQLRDVAPEFSQFLGAVAYVGVLDKVRAAAALRERRRQLENAIERESESYSAAIESGLTRLMMIEVEGAIHSLRAQSRWISGLIGEIESGSLRWSTESEAP